MKHILIWFVTDPYESACTGFRTSANDAGNDCYWRPDEEDHEGESDDSHEINGNLVHGYQRKHITNNEEREESDIEKGSLFYYHTFILQDFRMKGKYI